MLEKMNMQLFNCFTKLFELTNQLNGCINYNEESNKIQLLNYKKLKGIKIFWDILDQCKSKQVKIHHQNYNPTRS